MSQAPIDPTRPLGWPRCFVCEADGLVTLAPPEMLAAAAWVETPLTPYLTHGTRCTVCGDEREKPPKALQDTPTSWLIRVHEQLQNTNHGQHYALRSIPLQEKRRITSYRFERELRIGPYRWWRFLVTYEGGAQ